MRSPREIDELTLERARQGDEGACRDLVDLYQRAVFALLSRMLRPAGRSAFIEDLAQESFLRVFSNLDKFDPRGPARLSTWILTIASRLAVDELRRSRPLLLNPALVQSLPARERPGESAERQQVRKAIGRALAGLEEEQRAIFLLRAYHGRSLREIAGCFDLSIGTVKSRIARARALLRRALAEVSSDEDR